MQDACYVYCITWGQIDNVNLNGVNGESVYPIQVGNINVMVHNCSPEPYEGEDEVVKQWILQHNKVVEEVWQMQDTVLPMTFDIIIKANEQGSAVENIYKWITENQAVIESELLKLKGKAEYGVKIIIGPKYNLMDESNNTTLEKDDTLKGLAYLQKKKSRRNARRVFMDAIMKSKENYIKQIAERVSTIIENKSKKLKNKEQELLNLSLLASEKEAKDLGLLLEEIAAQDNIRVRYIGPWPPYSFVGDLLKNN